jgi:hypothetical protein
MRVIPFEINNQNVLVQKESERYIPEREIKEVIEDIIENNLDFPTNKFIDLSSICDKMFSILYRGIVSNDNILFEVC